MDYKSTLDYLYNKTLLFQHVGAAAYKPGLETTIALSRLYGYPEKSFATIHVAGTNGKGSTSHLLASILQESGYRVGLYTSPHMIDFRERIKVNGEMVDKEFVCSFVESFLNSKYDGRQPSFFELATIMAFSYFQEQKVDIAVIEVGLGGRLDSTNIITPILSVITNISFDHTQFLGNTLAAIATEKAGIIKQDVPVIISETTPETRQVFTQYAEKISAPIVFAEDSNEIISASHIDGMLHLDTVSFGKIIDQLDGDCQPLNANAVLHAIKLLKLNKIIIPLEAVINGFKNVATQTGLLGRWMTVNKQPLTICDTAHNSGGFKYIAERLKCIKCANMRIIFGFVSDKDISHILEMLPKEATYYFTQPSVSRALNCSILKEMANGYGLCGDVYTNVIEAYKTATTEASLDDMIYLGGSTFIVADFLSNYL